MKKIVLFFVFMAILTTGCNDKKPQPVEEVIIEQNDLYSSDEEAQAIIKENNDNNRPDEESFKIIQKTLETVVFRENDEIARKYNTIKPFKIVKMEDKHKDEYYWSVWTQSKAGYLETKMYNRVLKDGTFDYIDPSIKNSDDPTYNTLLDDKDVMIVETWDFPENVNKEFFEVDYSKFE